MLLCLAPWLLSLTGGWLRRIEQIQQAVAAIAAGDLSSTPEMPTARDELTALVQNIGQMCEQLRTLQAEQVRSERERLVAQLAAGFAHQFRNGVAGASLALQLHAGRCPSPGDRSLQVAIKQLRLLETEVRGMLSLARRAESPREEIDAVQLVREAAELVSPAIEHHQVRFQMELENPPLLPRGSHDGLRSAVLNLLLNAVEAAGPRGEVRLQLRSDHDAVEIAVRDNGPGPEPAVAHRMTEAFVTTKCEGVGLGLTVVNAVAHDHAGTLRWRRDGSWTVMSLVLPAVSATFQETRVPHGAGVGD
jgi:signal transduction histidine kinase